MSITLNPEQEALVREVVASGAVTSEDDALTIALTFLRDRVIDDLEERLGLTRAELDERLQAGRAGPADPWMGADAFCTAMRDHGRSHQ